MLVHVKVYYQKCPTCGATWSAQLSREPVIRIGRETYVCKCGTAWDTRKIEWAHLEPKLRRQYFFSSAEIGVVIIAVLTPPLFAYFISGASAAVMAATWGLLVGLVFVGVLWMIKMLIVRASLRRCSHADFAPHGGWPWN